MADAPKLSTDVLSWSRHAGCSRAKGSSNSPLPDGTGHAAAGGRTGGFNFAEVRAADTGGLESLLGQLGLAFNGRHRTKNVQLWTMGHARVIINEESTEDPQAVGAPAISALGFDVGSP